MEYLQDTLVYQLLAAQKRLVSAVKQDFREAGITHDNYITLHFIYENPGVTQTELAEINDKDPNVVVRAIDKLEEMGFVRRVRGNRDRRSFTLHITEQGEHIIDQYWDRLILRQEACLNDLSPAERDTLLGLLKRINRENIER